MCRTSPRLASFSPASLLVLLGGALASPSPGATYTVGAGGPPCTHATIALALAAAEATAGPDEIRVARNQSYSNQAHVFTDWSPATKGAVTIRGGFDDCADTEPNGKTELIGNGALPLFSVHTTSEPTSEVTLRDLAIKNSFVGVWVESGGRVRFENATVSMNDTSGILVELGGEADLDRFSLVAGNAGSGIVCDSGSTVNVAASVYANSGVSGGGIAARAGCHLNVLSAAGIFLNNATSGAGIYAADGAIVDIDGTNPGAYWTRIDHNTSSGSGGGIYATGAGTTVTIRNASVTANNAVNQGGGIIAYQGASVVMERVNGDCYDDARCSDLSGNFLTTGSLGAAAWAGAGADLTISQTYVDSNDILIASPTGNVLFATGAGTTLTVEGVGMWNNQGPDALIEGFDSAVVNVAFVSATGNVYSAGNLPARPIALSNGATGTLGSSIFFPNSPAIGAGALSELDCLIVSNNTGLSAGDFITVTDPLFLDPANGDLHLPSISPAVDYCDTVVTAPQHSDIDHEGRGFDLAANANGVPGVTGSTFDIGFDEHRGLFGDGFETGDTGAWSLTAP